MTTIELSKGAIDLIADAIVKKMKVSKMGHWIPVSERLPEEGKKFLVTVNYFDDGAKVRISENTKYGFLCGNVSAWMPLPEPYEPQESDG